MITKLNVYLYSAINGSLNVILSSFKLEISDMWNLPSSLIIELTKMDGSIILSSLEVQLKHNHYL